MSDPIYGDLNDPKWQRWYRLTPHERWAESMKLWELVLREGGILDPEPDPESPFDADFYPDADPGEVRPQFIVCGGSRTQS